MRPNLSAAQAPPAQSWDRSPRPAASRCTRTRTLSPNPESGRESTMWVSSARPCARCHASWQPLQPTARNRLQSCTRCLLRPMLPAAPYPSQRPMRPPGRASLPPSGSRPRASSCTWTTTRRRRLQTRIARHACRRADEPTGLPGSSHPASPASQRQIDRLRGDHRSLNAAGIRCLAPTERSGNTSRQDGTGRRTQYDWQSHPRSLLRRTAICTRPNPVCCRTRSHRCPGPGGFAARSRIIR